MVAHRRGFRDARRSESEALVALERAWNAGEPYALVLLDAMMPAMDGFIVAEQIRQQPALADLAE